MIAAISRTATTLTAFLAPIRRVIKPKINDPMILLTVDTKYRIRNFPSEKPTMEVALMSYCRKIWRT